MDGLVAGVVLFLIPLLAAGTCWQGPAAGWPSASTAAAVLLVAGFSRRLGRRGLEWFRARQPQGWPVQADRAMRFLARMTLLHGVLIGVYRAAGAGIARPGQVGPPGAALLAVVATHVTAVMLLPRADPFQRGRRLLGAGQGLVVRRSPRTSTDRGLPWGGLLLPSSAARWHFAVVGATGSGKTMTLRLLMQAVLPRITAGGGRRALVYDAKQDVCPLLDGLGLACPVELLHPLDRRGLAWDLARDCTGPATALQVASILIPAEEGANRFFADAARDLVTGALIALHLRAPGAWDLRDLLLVMKSGRHLYELLGQFAVTRDRLQYFNEPRTFQNVYTTAAARLAAFEPVAACWARAGRRLSLDEWVRHGESVLVLGADESVRTALDAVNRAIFRRLAELLLSQPEADSCRTWLFLDEVREAGRLDGLSSLLTRGRSKGCVVVLGFQDIDGLRAVYGSHVADELVGQCGNKAILRLESPGTAAWASQLLGEREEYDRSWSESSAAGERTRSSVAGQIVRRPAVLPSEFMDLPPAGPATGLTGYYLSPLVGAYRGRVPWKELSRGVRAAPGTSPDFVGRPTTDQYLRPWTAGERSRLGLLGGSADESPHDRAPAARLKVVPDKSVD
jgi:hypothetical protein